VNVPCKRLSSPHCALETFKSLAIMKMEAIYASETSVLTMATRCNISKDIPDCYRREDIPGERGGEGVRGGSPSVLHKTT
jgi:hypothetical protein